MENTEHFIKSEEFILKQSEPRFALHRVVEWIGPVTEENLNRSVAEIKELMLENTEEITLVVNSHGGPTGYSMTFFDVVRKVLLAPLVTIGTGDVDSSGVIIYLSGKKRYITKNTTMFFHVAGRRFEEGKRVTTSDMRAMLKEDTLKDRHYAMLVAAESRGKLTSFQVMEMMKKNTVLSASDVYEFGLADEIL